MNSVKISICIPAYNRVQFLRPLLDSILAQGYNDYEIVICEDDSPERNLIIEIINEYKARGYDKIILFLNKENLGYDGNIRELANKSRGEYCLYLGNDDLLQDDSLSYVAQALTDNPDVTYLLRSYGWFSKSPKLLDEEIHYFNGNKKFYGTEALRVGFRRAGVISGFIVKREVAINCATNKYDGTLYYQMHLAINAIKSGPLYYLDKVITLSRSTTPPDFGNAKRESGIYTPGKYTAIARLAMFSGAIKILKDQCSNEQIDVVIKDYSRHFYPYIKDQLNLPLKEYVSYYLSLGRIGFSKHPSFHFYCVLCYIIGEPLSDSIIKRLRHFRTVF